MRGTSSARRARSCGPSALAPALASTGGAFPVALPPDDADALADALHRLLNGDTVREGLQAGARSAAASLPQWADSASIVAKALREVQR